MKDDRVKAWRIIGEVDLALAVASWSQLK